MNQTLRAWLERWLSIETEDPQQRRRGQLLSYLILGGLIFSLGLLITNFIQWVVSAETDRLAYIACVIVCFLMFAGTFQLCRKGHIRLAAYGFLILCVVGIIALLPLRVLNHTLILYILPIILASFLISPSSSFVIALFYSAGYTIAFFTSPGLESYNYISIPSLFILAFVSWLLAGHLDKEFAERASAENAARSNAAELSESYKSLAAILNASTQGVLLMDPNGTILEANEALGRRFGRIAAGLRGMNVYSLIDPEVSLRRKELIEQAIYSRNPFLFEDTRDGRFYHNSVFPIIEEDNSVRKVAIFTADITDQKQAEQALIQERILLRTVIDHLPDAICVKDGAGCKILVNPVEVSYTGKPEDEVLGKTDLEVFPEEVDRNSYADEMTVLRNGQAILNREELVVNENGESHWVLTSKVPLKNEQGRVTGLVGIRRDISEIRRAKEEAAQKNQLFRMVIDNLPDAIYVKDYEGRTILSNAADMANIGKPESEVLGKSCEELFPTEVAARFHADDDMVLREGQAVINHEEFLVNGRGETRLMLTSKLPLRDNQGRITGLLGIGRDITERKRVENALRESEMRYRTLLQNANDAVFLHEITPEGPGAFLEVNNKVCEMLGYSREELSKMSLADVDVPEQKAYIPSIMEELYSTGHTVFLTEHIAKDGRRVPVEISASLIELQGRKTVLSFSRDIIERKKAEEALRESHHQIQDSLNRMRVLHDIDLAITSYTDQLQTIKTILKRITQLEELNAAALILPSQNGRNLTLVEQSGIPSDLLPKDANSWKEFYASLNFSEGRGIFLANLQESALSSPILQAIKNGFHSCAVLPLFIKDQVKGILLILSRDAHLFDPIWQDFMHSLAMQTAIAIDNASMLHKLQETNAELFDAYERTIIAWSRALELRDKETRNHSDRVRDLSERLARKIGIREEDMVHFRRGVLLHDIGKMGIPDSILLKPGPLTDDEWMIMRQHTLYAYNLLSPIPFLKRALDIPYYHHEKWDGSGYPNKLMGEEIPLWARIFAVVDVWDALTNNRPYRPAWSIDAACQYLIEQAGKHFDPQVVNAFIEVIEARDFI